MFEKLYDITLKLKMPSDQGNAIDFTDKQADILEAVGVFNEKYRAWDKRIVVYMISKKSIHLLLAMEKEKGSESTSARDIRSFAAYLNSVKNWNVFSRHSANLFESVKFTLADVNTAKDIVSSIDPDSQLYHAQREDIAFFNALKVTVHVSNEEDMELSDDEALAVFAYLLKTKNKGERSQEKKEALDIIKRTLKKWM